MYTGLLKTVILNKKHFFFHLSCLSNIEVQQVSSGFSNVCYLSLCCVVYARCLVSVSNVVKCVST